MRDWDYRILKKKIDVFCYAYGIYEVYYNNNGIPTTCSKDPMEPYGETKEELFNDFVFMMQAFTKPVLDYAEFEKREPKDE